MPVTVLTTLHILTHSFFSYVADFIKCLRKWMEQVCLTDTKTT